MASSTLGSGVAARQLGNGALNVTDYLITFSGAAFTDNDTVEICKLAPRTRIMDIKVALTDLDTGTDMEIDVGLNPAPGVTTADADVLVDGVTTSVQSAGFVSLFATAPTVSSGSITAGVGLETHAEDESTLYLTMIDNGTATSGTLYVQVYHTADSGFDSVAITNS